MQSRDRYGFVFPILQTAIHEGDYQGAAEILKGYDGVSVDIEFYNAQHPDDDDRNYTVSYDAQMLYMQELLINGDSHDWLNTELPNIDKANVEAFYNYLESNESEYSELFEEFHLALDSLYMNWEDY